MEKSIRAFEIQSGSICGSSKVLILEMIKKTKKITMTAMKNMRNLKSLAKKITRELINDVLLFNIITSYAKQ